MPNILHQKSKLESVRLADLCSNLVMSTKIQIHTLSQQKVAEKIQWLNSCGRLQQKRRKWLSLWRSLNCFGKYNLIQGNSKVQPQGGWLINIQESMWTVATIFLLILSHARSVNGFLQLKFPKQE